MKEEIINHLSMLDDNIHIMFKLTIPDTPDFYRALMSDPHVVRIVALSGGYTRQEANDKLAQNHGLIASFSRALTQGLHIDQSDEDFNALLKTSITSIYEASIL